MTRSATTGTGIGTGTVSSTRDRLLDVAERLFAEQGLGAVSHRRIAEEAGQANNSAVAYHIGDRRSLVAAIMRRHTEPIDRRRVAFLRDQGTPGDLRVHVEALVLPMTEHLAELGVPSWFARFTAAATADPLLRDLVLAQVLESAAMRQAMRAVLAVTPALPPAVATLRATMARHLVVDTCAEAERALAEQNPGDVGEASAWPLIGTALVDALLGLLRAPSTDPAG